MLTISDLAQIALDAEGSVVLATGLVDNTIADTSVQHTDAEVSLQLAVRQFLAQFGAQLVQPII
jgi:hypothetical protein